MSVVYILMDMSHNFELELATFLLGLQTKWNFLQVLLILWHFYLAIWRVRGLTPEKI